MGNMAFILPRRLLSVVSRGIYENEEINVSISVKSAIDELSTEIIDVLELIIGPDCTFDSQEIKNPPNTINNI